MRISDWNSDVCSSVLKGKTRDVMTLAHELGHGVHQVLAGPQGHLMADTPLTLAETASVFGEMLTFQALLKSERDPKRRKDRQSVVEGKSVSERVALGGRRNRKKNTTSTHISPIPL